MAIFVIFCLWQGTAAQQSPQSPNIEESPGKNQNLVKPSPTSVNNPSIARKRDSEANQNEGQSAPKWGDPQWLALAINALYSVVTTFTLVAIFRQNRSIQNTERAVLVPNWDNLVHLNPESTPGTISHCFQWNFQNCGKIPGFIRELQGTLILLKSMDDLPSRPKYDKRVLFQSDPLVPGKMMETMIHSPLEDLRDYQTVDAEFRRNGKILFA